MELVFQAAGHPHPRYMQSCIAALPSHMEAEAEARERGKAVTSRNWVKLVLVPS